MKIFSLIKHRIKRIGWAGFSFLANIVTIVAFLYYLYDNYKEERKLTPDDLKFKMTYCSNSNKEDVLTFCPESFCATLSLSDKPLIFVFNRIDIVNHKTIRGLGGNRYYVIYKSEYLFPEEDYSDTKIIESKNDIEGKELTLTFKNEYNGLQRMESEKSKINDGFVCKLYIKGKEYIGKPDSTYYSTYQYYNASSYKFSFKIYK